MLNGFTVTLPILLFLIISIIDRLVKKHSLLGTPSVSMRFVTAYLLLYAYVIVSAQVLAIFDWLKPEYWRYTTIIAVIAAFFISGSTKDIFSNNIFVDAYRSLVKQSATFKYLIFLSVIWIAFGIVRIYIIPSNDSDANNMHNFMEAAWLQNGNLNNLSSTNFWVSARAFNSHIMNMFHLSFSSDNTFIELPQLECWLVLFLASYALMNSYGLRPLYSLCFAQLVITSPILLGLSTSSLMDLHGIAMFSIFCLFLSRFFQHRSRKDIILSAIAFATMTGIRMQIILFIPSIILILLAWVFFQKENRLKWFFGLSGCFILASIPLGLPKYIHNLVDFGSLFPSQDPHLSKASLSNLWFNINTTWSYAFLEIPWSFKSLAAWYNCKSSYGLVFSFVFLPLSIGGLFEIEWKKIDKIFKTPLPLLCLVPISMITFGYNWHTPDEYYYQPRLLAPFAFPVMVFGCWTINQYLKKRSPKIILGAAFCSLILLIISTQMEIKKFSLFLVYLVMLMILVNTYTLVKKNKTISTITLYCSLQLIMIIIFLYLFKSLNSSLYFRYIYVGYIVTFLITLLPILAKEIKFKGYYPSLFIMLISMVIVNRHILSAKYDALSNVAVMKRYLKLSPSERKGIPENSLHRAIEQNVPKGAVVLIQNEEIFFSQVYTYMGKDHRYYLRFLNQWNEKDYSPNTTVTKVHQYLNQFQEVWLICLDEKRTGDTFHFPDLLVEKIGGGYVPFGNPSELALWKIEMNAR